jgi:AraC family ethanolamine operon transcriptional activator
LELVLDNQFDDLERLKSLIRAWDLDFKIVHKGGFQGRMRQVSNADMLITLADFGSHLHQAGTTPIAYRTFALPASDSQYFWWLGYEIDDCSITRFGTDNELACVSDQSFSVYTLSVKEQRLEKIVESLGLLPPSSDRSVTRIRKDQMLGLRDLARSAIFDGSGTSRKAAAERLLEQLLVSCAEGRKKQPVKARSRDRAVKRVIEHLNDDGCSHPGLSDLCTIANVSERTLRYAFQERYGISPVQFVRSWRLNSAHRLLRRSAKEKTTVADIAGACGFLDPSVFAKHYRSLHGELPSETVTRASD